MSENILKIHFREKSAEPIVLKFVVNNSPAAARWLRALYGSIKFDSEIVNGGNFHGLHFEENPIDEIGSFVNVIIDPINRVELEEEDYLQFTTKRGFGEVFISYEGLGKSVHQAFIDDSKPSVQTHLTSTFEISFYNDIDMPAHEKEAIRGWLDEKLSEGSEKYMQNLGLIPVARLKTEKSRKRILSELAENQKIVKIEIEGEIDFGYESKEVPFESIIKKYIDIRTKKYNFEYIVVEYPNESTQLSETLTNLYTIATVYPQQYSVVEIEKLNQFLKQNASRVDFFVILSQGSLILELDRFERELNNTFDLIEKDIVMVGDLQVHKEFAPLISEGLIIINTKRYSEIKCPPYYFENQVVVSVPPYKTEVDEEAEAKQALFVRPTEEGKREFFPAWKGSAIIAQGLAAGYSTIQTPVTLNRNLQTHKPSEDSEFRMNFLEKDREVLVRQEDLSFNMLRSFSVPIPVGFKATNVYSSNYFALLRYIKETDMESYQAQLFTANKYEMSFLKEVEGRTSVEELVDVASNTLKKSVGKRGFQQKVESSLKTFLNRNLGSNSEIERHIPRANIEEYKLLKSSVDLSKVFESIDPNEDTYVFLGNFILNRKNLFKKPLDELTEEFLKEASALSSRIGGNLIVHKKYLAAQILHEKKCRVFITDGKFDEDYWKAENWTEYDRC